MSSNSSFPISISYLHLQCPPDGNVSPIPNLTDRNYCAIAGNNITDQRMIACCDPNPVHISPQGCSEWCDIPYRYFRGLKGDESDREVVHSDFHNCLALADTSQTVRASLCYLPAISGAAAAGSGLGLNLGLGPGTGVSVKLGAEIVAVLVSLWHMVW